MYNENFARHLHWVYETYHNYGIFGTYSNRFDEFICQKDCLPWYQCFIEDKSIDWVDARIIELEDKSKNIANDSWDLDTELSDCYYYSMSRRLLRRCDAFSLDECAFEKKMCFRKKRFKT